MEKVKNNSRLIVAGLIIVGVLVLALTGNNDKSSQEQTGQTNVSAQTDSESAKETTKVPASVDEPIGSQPTAGPVVVDQVEDSYSATVRKGDNQTVIVRQMVNEFLQDRSQSLSAEQRLYIETVLVDALPRNNLIYPDQVVQIKADVLSSAVDASATLSEAQIAAWSGYL